MIFGADRKRFEELEAENANLKKWVEYLNGFDAIQRTQLITHLQEQSQALSQQLAATQAELDVKRQQIVETEELTLLQEIGIYKYRHPLDDAVAYQSKLKQAKDAISTLAKNGAVHSATGWTVNSSAKDGAKMTRDLSKLMLRAYNAEADNLVRFLRPHSLASAIARLNKSRETIAKLGSILQIQITDDYHRWRVYELELTADYLVKVEEEKERLREARARQREDEKAMRELEAERIRLQKEQAHYQAALQKLQAKGDVDAAREMESKIAQIATAIDGIESREANIRAGYVYVISNFGSFGEHIVKIGMTRRLDPMERVYELGDASVPFKFDVHAIVFSDDAVGLEAKLHAHFKERRVNLINFRREYFYVTPEEVRAALETLDRNHLLEFKLVPEAPEWRASGGSNRTTAVTGRSHVVAKQSSAHSLEPN